MFLLRRAGWILFAALLAACVAAWWLTEAAVSTAGFPATAQSRSSVPAAERPLSIASALSALADTPAEKQLAAQAQSLAQSLVDEAVRQQLADAAQGGGRQHGPLWKRVQTAQAASAREQTALQQLQAQFRRAAPAARAAIQAQMQLTQAQLQLDQARLADAQEDLGRQNGAAATPAAIAARQKSAQSAAIQAAHKWRTQWEQQSSRRNPAGAHGLAGLVDAWRLLAAKQKALQWAQAQAQGAAAQAQAAHDRLHAQLQAAEAQNGRRMSGALGQLRLGRAAAQTQALADSAEQLAAGQRRLIGLDQGAQLHQELAQAYQHWSAIGRAQEELALHDAAGMLLAILLGIAVLLALDRLALRALARTRPERRRAHTVRHLLRFSLEVVGVIWILLTVMGSPAQWLTFLGLAGAGLTVALQDTILSFFGWFVLIGRRGLAPGDWVEIHNISGEVLEVTLLQTAVLEAGNWTEPGHRTGRRVLFPNSFVFTGPYMKYATHGQWLWDEIRLPLANGAALPDLGALAQWVEQETREDAASAARDWETHLAGRHPHGSEALDARAFAPAVQIKPGVEETMDLSIRYITHAAGRAARREHFYRRIYEARAAAR